MFFRSKNIIKKCEHCGDSISSPFESLLFEIDYYIFLKNQDFERIDQDSQRVHSKSGGVIPYTFMVNSDLACETNRHMIYRFCSEKCATEVIKKHSVIFRDDFFEKALTFSPAKMNVHVLDAVPLTQIKTDDIKCEECGDYFKEIFEPKGTTKEQSNRRKWISYKINKFKKKKSNHPLDPALINAIQSKYPLILTGLAENKKTYGSLFCYNANMTDPTDHNLCGTECGLSLSKRTNRIIITNSLIEKNRMGIICPKSEQINMDLENRVLSRPSYMG